MFRLIEALNDRLIGPKPWDRIDMNFLKPKCLAHNCEGCLGVLIHIFVINHGLIWMRPEMAVKCGFTK